jgi:hypothetical protein
MSFLAETRNLLSTGSFSILAYLFLIISCKPPYFIMVSPKPDLDSYKKAYSLLEKWYKIFLKE